MRIPYPELTLVLGCAPPVVTVSETGISAFDTGEPATDTKLLVSEVPDPGPDEAVQLLEWNRLVRAKTTLDVLG